MCCLRIRLLSSFKVLINLICISMVVLVIWTLTHTQTKRPWIYKKVESFERNNTYYKIDSNDVSKTFDPNSTDLMYVLFWDYADWAPFSFFTSEYIFIDNNCSFANCYVTRNRELFGAKKYKFHAVAFNGRQEIVNLSEIPRWPHQKFIYYNTESSDYFRVRTKVYDSFFNWTSTYRLDSDVPYPYILVRNSSGHIVGPKRHMKWRDNMTEVDEELASRLKSRNRWMAAVAFMSNCGSRSKRDLFMAKLKKSLMAYGFVLDIYGSCGNKKCPIGLLECDKKVRAYYFYLAFENSFAEDYVTEKLLRAVNNDVVPIVYGGADYTRFLPPDSYLDARKYTPDELAVIIVELIQDPDKYRRYFGWRKHYTYHNPMTKENICSLCEALNNKTKYLTTSVYKSLDAWWNH